MASVVHQEFGETENLSSCWETRNLRGITSLDRFTSLASEQFLTGALPHVPCSAVSTGRAETLDVLPTLAVNVGCTQTNRGKNRKSYPHLSAYFYINIVLNIETSQYLCRIQHMPGRSAGLLCLLTHLFSQQPHEVRYYYHPHLQMKNQTQSA